MKIKNLSGRIIISGVFLFAVLLSFGSCIFEERMEVPQSNDRALTFSVSLPGVNTPQTYALNEVDENKVQSIEILLFDSNGNYTSQPIYCNTIISDTEDSRLKTFTAKVPEGTYNMVLLANSRVSLSNILGSIAIGDSKESVLKKLIVSNAGKWNTSPSSTGYIPVPMWGEIASITVNSSIPANQKIALTRMVAKVDVTLITAAAQANFKLKSVDLYNYYDQGHIVPNAENWTQNINRASVPPEAKKPSDPAISPLSYTTMTTPDIACEGEIYTFETEKGSSSSLSTNTCLVIGGIYGSDMKPTYYRVDFVHTSNSITTYLELLRNHHYKINITEVSGPGLETSKDAFNSNPINIKAEVIRWNDALVTDIAFDKQYMLGVSQGEFTLTYKVHDASSVNNTLSVTTDVPTGWTVKEITDSSQAGGAAIDWLSTDLSPASGPANATTSTKLILAQNTSKIPRTGYIHLSAGRLIYVIKVTQDGKIDLEIRITDPLTGNDISELIFSPYGEPRQFKVSWLPALIESTITTETPTGAIVFNYGSGDNLNTISSTAAAMSSTPGEQIFTINPPEMTLEERLSEEYIEKSSKVNFTVTYKEDVISKSITLRQTNFVLITSGIASAYMLNGETQSFNVKSNAAWRIASVTPVVTSGSENLLQSSGNLIAGTTGGYDSSPGTPISFTPTNNESELKGMVTVVFESTNIPKRFSDVTATFELVSQYYPQKHRGWAGSNIYYDSELNRLTFDDVNNTDNRLVQGVHFLWGSLYGIDPAIRSKSKLIVYSPLGGKSLFRDIEELDDEVKKFSYTSGNLIISIPSDRKKDVDRAYLYEITGHSTEKGDICKYLTEQAGGTLHGSRWRMPTISEYDPSNGTYAPSGNFSEETTTDEAGKGIINSYLTKNGIGSPYFPAAGFRSFENPVMSGSGQAGCYWSSSPVPFTDLAYHIYFTGTFNNFSGKNVRTLLMSVRCVRE